MPQLFYILSALDEQKAAEVLGERKLANKVSNYS